MKQLLQKQLDIIKRDKSISDLVMNQAKAIYLSGACNVLSQSKLRFEFLVTDTFEDYEVSLVINELDGSVSAYTKGQEEGWNRLAIAALMQLLDENNRLEMPHNLEEGKKYSREGMMKRVIEERKEKALNLKYRIEYSDNIYGEHVVVNEKGVRYKVFLRDFEKEIGYSDSMDWKTNKLGTTKHIMFAFHTIKNSPNAFKKLSKTYPFVEIFTDPLNQYQVTWHYPHELNPSVKELISKYFGEKNYIEDHKLTKFLGFIREAEKHKQICIRPEVLERVEKAFNDSLFQEVQERSQIDYSLIKAELFPYQKEGIEFATFRQGAMIADEMGLGKTIQAIGTAISKKDIFGFKKTLVICPATVKQQWANEIEKFSNEKVEIVNGLPEQREKRYKESDAFFLIVNYETILRDSEAINEADIDFIILDEAQKIKNFTTKTSSAINSLKKKHALVITGTPIENRLIDLYSLVYFLDPYFLSPLWEFSYQHCLFDESSPNKITGYYNLTQLKERLKPILLRREKRNVIKQLPNIQQVDVPIMLHPKQLEYHASFATGVAQIVNKKFITPFDFQKLMLLLNNMRMACDSTNLIDKETHHSPKLDELRHILVEKLDLPNNPKKVVIFSEWIRMCQIIGKMLKENNIGYVELSGEVPVKHRNDRVKHFETNEDCKVFLSTEAGGAGLNLQMADTVINFELPWNPAKKNQRIGRIDRLGQKSDNLTVINLIAKDSIEMRVASGLMLKQNLFEGVLDTDNFTDEVDFSGKNQMQFLMELQNMINGLDSLEVEDEYITWDKESYMINDDGPYTTSDQLDNNHNSDGFENSENTEEVPENELETELAADSTENTQKVSIENSEEEAKKSPAPQHEQMEQVLQQGLGFLTGIFKMATGKDLGVNQQSIEINKETGEVVMKFKLPSFK
jgi:SNF2 family DNA or RNA helicase